MDVGNPADGADGAVGSRVHPNVEREEPGGPRTPPPLPVDPDLPVERPRLGARAARALRDRWDILAVIAGGGAVGSAARYGLAEAMPHEPGQVAWSTAVVNVAGGFVLGALMVFVVDVWPQLSPKAAARLQMVANFFVLVFALVFVGWGVQFVRFGWDQTSELAEMPMVFIFSAWPVAGLTWVLFLGEAYLHDWRVITGRVGR